MTVASNTLTVGGAISDSGSGYSLTKAGTGMLVLGGSDTYTGGTTVNSGLLDFATPSAVPTGAGSISINSGGVVLVVGAYTTVMGWLNSSTINPASAGALALAGTSSEAITMGSYASLSLGASGAATYNGVLTPSGTTYRLGGSSGGTLTFASALTGSNSLAVTGSGIIILTGTNNTFSGGTTVGGGTLQLGNAAALGGSTSAPLVVSSGDTLDLEGYSIGVGVLFGAGIIDNLNNSSGSSTSTLTIGNGNASSTFSGTIANTTGSIALTKTGTGTLALAGSNTYSGG